MKETGGVWQCLAMTGIVWQFLAMSGNVWQGCDWQTLAVTGKHTDLVLTFTCISLATIAVHLTLSLVY